MNILPVRVALIGMGRMGQAIDSLAATRGCAIVARLDAAQMAHGIAVEDLAHAQVAIDFTTPGSVVDNALACLRVGCPVVIGTTGWGARIADVERAVQAHRCAALWSPNFAIGVQLFLAFAADAAKRLRGQSTFDAHIVETHHAAKRDAPSGTAIALAQHVADALAREVPISSVRTGSVPGTHEIIFDAPFEQIRLVHEARDRRVFADGALAAARWLSTATQPFLYTMQDVLADGETGA